MIRLLALPPAAVALGIVLTWTLSPTSGLLALFAILSVHLALACLALVPIAIKWPSRDLRWSLAALLVVTVARFAGEWVSLPPAASSADRLSVATWNLEFGAVGVQTTIDRLTTLDADIIALQELTPEQASAIESSAAVTDRFPHRALDPRPGVFGIGVLSGHPIAAVDSFEDPSGLALTVEWDGRSTVVIAAHPLPASISTVTGLRIPTDFDPAARDLRLRALRTRIDGLLREGVDLVVLGDFNIAPTEPAYRALVAGLSDAHVEVGQGPGWSWRPSRFEVLPIGLLRIDLILSSPGLRPVASGVMCPSVGDHCVVTADLITAD